MKSYETLKAELSSRRKNIRGFNEAFYNQFVHDLETAQKGVEEAETLNIHFSITDFWNKSETHNTYFYKNNGDAYCEFLELI